MPPILRVMVNGHRKLVNHPLSSIPPLPSLSPPLKGMNRIFLSAGFSLPWAGLNVVNRVCK